METLNLTIGDTLIADPCYIKEVSYADEPRYDALKHIQTLHEGDDGEFPVKLDNGETIYLGVDSGRIWKMVAEFECVVKIDAGFSGYKLIRKGDK